MCNSSLESQKGNRVNTHRWKRDFRSDGARDLFLAGVT